MTRQELYRARAEIEPGHESAPRELLARVNTLSMTPLTWDDVHVRSMYLCSDQVCPADWLCFTQRALERIARLVPGRSVLAGHDRRSLPLARFCHAAVTTRPDAPGRWVRAWFYWLRDTAGAHDLLRNIDGGIYREVSIAWRYRNDRCSICGASSCEHEPGQRYNGATCHRQVDEVLDVLEGSLVYRGADADATVAAHAAHAQPARRAHAALHALDVANAARLADLLTVLDPATRRALLVGALPPALGAACLDLGLCAHWLDGPAAARDWGLPPIERVTDREGAPCLTWVERAWRDADAWERLAVDLPLGTVVVAAPTIDRAALGVHALTGEWPRRTAQVALDTQPLLLAAGRRG